MLTQIECYVIFISFGAQIGLIFIFPIEKFPRGFGLNKSWLKGQRFVHSKADYEKKRKKAFILFTRFSVIILSSKDSKQVLEWLFRTLAWVRANYLIDKNNKALRPVNVFDNRCIFRKMTIQNQKFWSKIPGTFSFR